MSSMGLDHRSDGLQLPRGPLIATVPLPPTTNKLYYNTPHGRALTKAGRIYKLSVHEHLWEIHALNHLPRAPYTLSMWFMLPDRRRRDLSNMVKALEDALASYLRYDDSLHHVLNLYKALDRCSPRAIIKLEHKGESIPAPPEGYLLEA